MPGPVKQLFGLMRLEWRALHGGVRVKMA